MVTKRPLADLLKEGNRNGLTKPKRVRGTGVKMVGMGEIFSHSRISDIDMERVPVTDKELQNYSLQTNDLLFARQSLVWEGAGKCSVIVEVNEPTVFESHLIRVRIDESIANPLFVYYFFNSTLGHKYVLTIVEQVAAAGLRSSDLVKLEIPCPDIIVQNKCASLLEALDKKIDANATINKNLEEQAKAIVGAYFIDFIPYGGTAPQNWPMVSLNDICEKITDGSHYSPTDSPEAPYPMYSVKDMRAYGFDPSSCKHITAEELQKMKQNDCVPQMDDILVAKDGSYLKEIFICSATRDEAILSSIAIFRPNRNMIEPEILLYFLKQPSIRKDVGDNYVSGSALPRIVLKDFKKYPVLLPPMDEQHKISDLLHSYRMKIQSNVDEIYRLQTMRNALLPRLMSGEIDVSSIEL